MYVQTLLTRQRKTITDPSGAPKEEDIVDDMLPATTSSFSKRAKAVMATLIKERAPVCAFYDVDLRNVVEELRAGGG